MVKGTKGYTRQQYRYTGKKYRYSAQKCRYRHIGQKYRYYSRRFVILAIVKLLNYSMDLYKCTNAIHLNSNFDFLIDIRWYDLPIVQKIHA